MTKIESEQAKFLKDLKNLVGKSIPKLDKVFILASKRFCGIKVEGENIIELTISHHYDLTSLPESIGNLKSLQKLILNSNKLVTLPESIGRLESLEILWLSDRHIKSLPDSIGNLQSLQELVIETSITTLPESIGNLQSLQKLRAHGKGSASSIETLPDSIGNLQSLKELTLGVKSSNLPESLGNLKSLEKLTLAGNQLTTLPDSLWKLKSLTVLDLRGNQWGLDVTLLKKGSKTVPRMLELWRHRIPINVFVSYSPEDEERFLINQMKVGLKTMPEIREVYSEKESEILESHLFLFIISKNSINNKKNQDELLSAISHKINIIPLKAPEIIWEELSNIDLGVDYNIGEKLGIEFEEKNTGFFLDLYDHIRKYKREVNLLEPLEGRVDKQWLNAKMISDNFVNSDEFREIYRENKEKFKELTQKFKDGQLSPREYITKTGEILK